MQKIVKLFLLSLFLFSANAFADNWNINADQSFLKFTATQNNSSVIGEFKKFDGEINFDPKNLAKSNVKIIIDINSVSSTNPDVPSSLKTDDWFAIKLFPNAIFKANKFTKIDNQNYQAEGSLTIRDKTLPLILNFTLEEYSAKSTKAKGSTIIKRNDFGIGQGAWAKTDSIKNEVKIDFLISANK